MSESGVTTLSGVSQLAGNAGSFAAFSLANAGSFTRNTAAYPIHLPSTVGTLSAQFSRITSHTSGKMAHAGIFRVPPTSAAPASSGEQ